jgi:hypothetical protein
VSKWAPDQFSGQQEDLRVIELKFRSDVVAMLNGTIGLSMDDAKENPDSNQWLWPLKFALQRQCCTRV